MDILRALIRQRGVIRESLAEVGRMDACHNFSGADLESLLRKAGQHALRRRAEVVEEIDLVEAVKTIRPSVGDIKKYEDLRKRFETKLF